MVLIRMISITLVRRYLMKNSDEAKIQVILVFQSMQCADLIEVNALIILSFRIGLYNENMLVFGVVSQ